MIATTTLARRRTQLQFDDHESAPLDIDIGIGQVNPLSTILYLFYNVQMLETVTGTRFVDDLALITASDIFDEVHAKLKHMMERPGEGCGWVDKHNPPQRFYKTKLLDLVNLAKRRHLDYQPRGINIRGNRIENVKNFKYLRL